MGNEAICPICSSGRVDEQQTIPDNEYGLRYQATYQHCGECACFYQWPMPDGEQLSSFYPAAYHSMQSKSIIASIKNHLRLRALQQMLQPGDTFMDFGCGNGSFILFASEKKPDNSFFGYEIDAENSSTSYNDGKVIIIKGSWEYLKDNIPTCKVISMHHVIEHLPDPKETIQYLYQKLVPGGVIIGQTPATDSFERRLFKKRWSGFHAPRHTVIFSRKALTRLLTDTGFTEVKIKTGLNPAAYAVSVASLFNGKDGGTIRRSGIKWILFVLIALALTPVDRIFGGSIIDFYGYKR